MVEFLENENIKVIYSSDITIYKKNDVNETTCYTVGKRNLNKAWEIIKFAFDSKVFGEVTYGQILTILDDLKIKYHSYCGLD